MPLGMPPGPSQAPPAQPALLRREGPRQKSAAEKGPHPPQVLARPLPARPCGSCNPLHLRAHCDAIPRQSSLRSASQPEGSSGEHAGPEPRVGVARAWGGRRRHLDGGTPRSTPLTSHLDHNKRRSQASGAARAQRKPRPSGQHEHARLIDRGGQRAGRRRGVQGEGAGRRAEDGAAPARAVVAGFEVGGGRRTSRAGSARPRRACPSPRPSPPRPPPPPPPPRLLPPPPQLSPSCGGRWRGWLLSPAQPSLHPQAGTVTEQEDSPGDSILLIFFSQFLSASSFLPPFFHIRP